MEVAVLDVKKKTVIHNSKEQLANNLWELLVLGELNEDVNIKNQFVNIENEIMSNKKSDC